MDIVLLVEALTPEFGRRFWEFIHDGGYEHRVKGSGEPQFYRFDRPTDARFPYMIELFSRKADSFLGDVISPCVPLPLGEEISSLSAILLNEDYYSLLLQGKTSLDELSVLSPLYLIPFKAKAWLDLSQRRSQGQPIDSHDIRKQKNDVVRLITLLTGNERCELSDIIRKDMEKFVAALAEAPIDPKALQIRGINSMDIVQVLQNVYL